MIEAKDTEQMKRDISRQEEGVVLWDKRNVYVFLLLNLSEDMSYNKFPLNVVRIHKFRSN